MSISIKANTNNLGANSEVCGVVYLNTCKEELQFRGVIVELVGKEKTKQTHTVTRQNPEGGTRTERVPVTETSNFLKKKQMLQIAQFPIDNHTVCKKIELSLQKYSYNNSRDLPHSQLEIINFHFHFICQATYFPLHILNLWLQLNITLKPK